MTTVILHICPRKSEGWRRLHAYLRKKKVGTLEKNTDIKLLVLNTLVILRGVRMADDNVQEGGEWKPEMLLLIERWRGRKDSKIIGRRELSEITTERGRLNHRMDLTVVEIQL